MSKELFIKYSTQLKKLRCAYVKGMGIAPHKPILILSIIQLIAKGVINSQLIQTSIDTLEIKIVPSEEFDPKSMEDVIQSAKYYLGDMQVKWEIVKELEKTTNGKVRYVIRKF